LHVLCTASTATSNTCISKGRYFEADRRSNYICCLWFTGGRAEKYLRAREEVCEFVYDESERSHTSKIVSEFSTTGIGVECGNIRTHKKLGQRMKFDDVMHNIFGNKITGIEGSEGTMINNISNVAKIFKSALSAEFENMEAHNEAGQNIKPKEVNVLFLETSIKSVNLGN
jgi:hypothetical protein